MDIDKMIREELTNMIKESKKKSGTIESKLDDLREKLLPSMLKRKSSSESSPRLERHIPVAMVSEIIGESLNDLVLYFLNMVKANNSKHQLIEMHSGNVWFYLS
jgi:hypothetical protein